MKKVVLILLAVAFMVSFVVCSVNVTAAEEIMTEANNSEFARFLRYGQTRAAVSAFVNEHFARRIAFKGHISLIYPTRSRMSPNTFDVDIWPGDFNSDDDISMSPYFIIQGLNNPQEPLFQPGNISIIADIMGIGDDGLSVLILPRHIERRPARPRR